MERIIKKLICKVKGHKGIVKDDLKSAFGFNMKQITIESESPRAHGKLYGLIKGKELDLEDYIFYVGLFLLWWIMMIIWLLITSNL